MFKDVFIIANKQLQGSKLVFAFSILSIFYQLFRRIIDY
ncbi:hypothetical protein QIM_0691 [Clostridioides difficile DA00128]|nr:hypothetical protein QIM_0691 [Clostridioides difficile DA00128]